MNAKETLISDVPPVCMIGLALCILFMDGPSAIAQIEGFTESFTGMGDYQSVGGTYDGLDNPGWAIGGTVGAEGVLTDDGFEFVADSVVVGIMTYDENSSMFSASYEPDVSDNEPPIELSIPLSFELSAETEVRWRAVSEVLGRVTGILNSWSLTPISGIAGDFNGSGELDANDMDLLAAEIRSASNDTAFDVNLDSVVDHLDSEAWVHDLKNTYFGDANLDNEFDSVDLVFVLGSGEYEDGIVGNSGWATGDWDGDSEFTSSDLVKAFADGGYDQGPQVGVAAVPEPSGVFLMVVTFAGLPVGLRTRRKDDSVGIPAVSATRRRSRTL